MHLTYVIGKSGIVEQPGDAHSFALRMPDGTKSEDFEHLDALKDKKPPEGCTVYFQGKNYPLVAVQVGINDLVYEAIIDTKDCTEFRLGTNMAAKKENRHEFSSLGIHMVTQGWIGRRLRTGARVNWRSEEGWYDK